MYLNLFFVLLSLIIVSNSAYLYKKVMINSIFKLNMVSMSFWILLILCYLPSFLILIDFSIFSTDYDYIIYGNFNNKLFAWLILSWLIIAIPIGAIFAKLIIFNKLKLNNKIDNFVSLMNIQIGFGIRERILYIVLFIYFILFSLQSYLIASEMNPLLTALSGGNHVDISVSRRELSLGTGFFLYDLLFRNDTILIFSLVTFVISLKTKELKWRFLFTCMFLFTIVSGLVGGSTGSIIFYLSVIFYLRYIVIGKLIYLHELLFGLIFIFLIFIYFKSEDNKSIEFMLNHFFGRIFFDQGKGFYYALQIFPNTNPFIGLSSAALWFHNLIDASSSQDYGHILMYNFSPEAVESGYAGHFTSFFITEMWANFGWWGVIFGPLWVGVVIFSVNYIFEIRKFTVISLAYYAHICILGFGYFSDFIRFYYPVNIFFTYLGPLLILWTASLLSNRFLNIKFKSIPILLK